MGMLDNFDWEKLWNSPSMKMAGEGWRASLPGFTLNALATTPTAQSVASGATLPGDVYAGRQPMGLPSETEDLSRVADMTGLMMKGGSAANTTGQIPKGAIGTFAGPRAKNAPIKDYMAGAKMERKGATPEDIWQERGVFRDLDQNWAHEIPNTGHDFIPELPLNRQSEGRLGGLFRAPELYAAYPDLAKTPMTVNPRKRDVYGAFGTTGDRRDPGWIRAQGPRDTLRETGIHEIEHAVQRAERRFEIGNGDGGTKNLSDYAYLTHPAERMARAAQNRRDYTPAQRREVHPLKTPESPETAAWLKAAEAEEKSLLEMARGDLIKSGILRERRWF